MLNCLRSGDDVVVSVDGVCLLSEIRIWGSAMVHKSTHVLQHRCKMLTDCCKAPIRATVLASPWPITSSLFWLRNADLRIRAAATLCRVCSSHAVILTMGIFMFGMDREHKGDRSQ